MRYVLKLVGLILVFTLGVLPSVALAGTCTEMRTSHSCCSPKLVPQTSMAMNGPEAPAPCCKFSSGQAAPATESQIQTAASGAYRPIATAVPLMMRPVRSALGSELVCAVLLTPAQSTLCTFLI